MREESEDRSGYLMPTREKVDAAQGEAGAGPLGLSLMAIDAGDQMEEMERASGAGGNITLPNGALASLRRWQSDPRLDSASRMRASALVWKFEPNGWDEV